MFDHLGVTRPQFGKRKSFKKSRADNHCLGLVKYSDVVFKSIEIDPEFSANTGIHLGKKGGWDIDKPDASFVSAGTKSAHITRYSPAKIDDQGFAVKTLIGHPLPDIGASVQVF